MDRVQQRDAPINTYLYLREKYSAVQAQWAQLRHHYVLKVQAQWAHWRTLSIPIECAWCQKRIRWQIMPAPVPVPMPSHGICARCYATVTRELALMSRGLPLTECAGAGSVWGRAVYGER